MLCKNCNHTISTEDSFCEKCGAKVNVPLNNINLNNSSQISSFDRNEAFEQTKPAEKVIFENMCNRVKDNNRLDYGRAMLTDTRFIFFKHNLGKVIAMNMFVHLTNAKYNFEIDLKDIATIEQVKFRLSTLLQIKTIQGITYRFYFNNIEDWIKALSFECMRAYNEQTSANTHSNNNNFNRSYVDNYTNTSNEQVEILPRQNSVFAQLKISSKHYLVIGLAITVLIVILALIIGIQITNSSSVRIINNSSSPSGKSYSITFEEFKDELNKNLLNQQDVLPLYDSDWIDSGIIDSGLRAYSVKIDDGWNLFVRCDPDSDKVVELFSTFTMASTNEEQISYTEGQLILVYGTNVLPNDTLNITLNDFEYSLMPNSTNENYSYEGIIHSEGTEITIITTVLRGETFIWCSFGIV